MGSINDYIIKEIVKNFTFEGTYIGATPNSSGHINDTYVVKFQSGNGKTKPYTLQRINTNVFKNPDELMENIINITGYIRDAVIREGGDPSRETLTLIPTIEGRAYYRDGEGGCWRAYIYIEDATTFQQIRHSIDLYHVARAFGKFQQLLAEYPANTLYETIPNFHNTVDRMEKLKEAITNDVCNRAADVQEEIAFAFTHEADAQQLIDLQNAGKLPLRVTHNDTKINNVLIDSKTGEGICVIDLDTVMPGLSLYDFGDSIRTGATYAAEDEKDLSKVKLDMDLFEAYTKGYLETAGKILTQSEVENLPMGAKLMTFENGIRFLTDYLSGDSYFKIAREGHNLDRCRAQFKLVSDMEKRWEQMNRIVEKYGAVHSR